MTWVKLDDAFFTHRKIISLPLEAKTIFIAGLCFSSAQLTDGFLSQDAIRTILAMLDIPRRKGAKIVQVLEQNSLWKPRGNGYEIHDYLHYQPSAEDVRKNRESTARRVRDWRAGNGVSNGVTEGVSNGVSNASPPPQPSPDPDPDHSLSSDPQEVDQPTVAAAAGAREANDPPPATEAAAAAAVSQKPVDLHALGMRVAAAAGWREGKYDVRALASVLHCYTSAGPPGDLASERIIAETVKAREWCAEHHKRLTLTLLDNWLKREQETQRHAAAKAATNAASANHNHAGGQQRNGHHTERPDSDQPDYYELQRRRAQAQVDAAERDRAFLAELVRDRKASGL